MFAFLKARLDRDARAFHRLWSIRIQLFWGAFSILAAVWPTLNEAIPTWIFATVTGLIAALTIVARITKQPGIDNE